MAAPPAIRNPLSIRCISMERTESQNNQMVAAYRRPDRQAVNIADAYAEEGFDFSGTRNFDKKTGNRSKAFLTVR